MKLYASLADAYYLNPDVEPNVHCQRGELVVRIPLRRES